MSNRFSRSLMAARVWGGPTSVRAAVYRRRRVATMCLPSAYAWGANRDISGRETV